MRNVTIPDHQQPSFDVAINGVKYSYPAGAQVDVPDEVADLIEALENLKPPFEIPTGDPVQEQTDLVIFLRFPSHVTPRYEDISATVYSGSLDAVIEGLRSGRLPVVKCKHFYGPSKFDVSTSHIEYGMYDCSVYCDNGDIEFRFFLNSLYSMRLAMTVDSPDHIQIGYHKFSSTYIVVEPEEDDEDA